MHRVKSRLPAYCVARIGRWQLKRVCPLLVRYVVFALTIAYIKIIVIIMSKYTITNFPRTIWLYFFMTQA